MLYAKFSLNSHVILSHYMYVSATDSFSSFFTVCVLNNTCYLCKCMDKGDHIAIFQRHRTSIITQLFYLGNLISL